MAIEIYLNLGLLSRSSKNQMKNLQTRMHVVPGVADKNESNDKA